MFERYYADRNPRKFYACALHRDRKGCPFFHWVDEPVSQDKRERCVMDVCSAAMALQASLSLSARWMKAYLEANPKTDHSDLKETLESIQCLSREQRGFCHTCSQLFTLSKSLSSGHRGHRVQRGVADDLLSQPTRLLIPRDDKKSNAVSDGPGIIMYIHVPDM